jgi:hypothetical protein
MHLEETQRRDPDEKQQNSQRIHGSGTWVTDWRERAGGAAASGGGLQNSRPRVGVGASRDDRHCERDLEVSLEVAAAVENSRPAV